jgi:hypothetical protein
VWPVPGTFELFVEVSQGDNAGLAGFEFFFDDIDSVQNLSPRSAFDPGAVSSTGFALLTSADDDPNLAAVQHSLNPDSIIYGFGQTAGAFGVGTILPIPTSGSWDSPLLVARGTYSGDPVDIVGSGGPGHANLWTAEGSSTTISPDGSDVLYPPLTGPPHAHCIPEPSSWLLAFCGGLVALAGTRRHG